MHLAPSAASSSRSGGDRRSTPRRQLRPDNGSAARGALNPEFPAERFDPVGESAKPGASRQARTAVSVVADLDHDQLGGRRQLDAPFGRPGMLRGVGQAFRDDVVQRRFDRLGQPDRGNTGDLHRERRPFCE